MLQMTM